jgi:type IV fimbrial biogenesis protein FimT
MKNQKHFFKGFTMIELMIVVAILAIIASIAFPSYRTYIENSRIRNAAESIQNGVQKARTAAVQNNARVSFTLGANSAWTIGCTTATALCPAEIEKHVVGATMATVTTTKTPAAATQIFFTNLGTRDATAGQLTQITIDNTKLATADSRELNVTIGAGGNVRMCDPNLPTGNLRAC